LLRLRDRNAKVTNNQPTGRVIERTTLDDLLKLIENNYAVKGRRSLRRVEHAERNLREYFGGERKARDVTSEDIAAYAAYRTEKGAAPRSINYDTAILRRGFRLGKKIVSATPDFEMMGLSNIRKGFFEAEQYRAVLNQLPEYLRPVVTTAYVTDCRVASELLTRQWKHVDLNAGWLRLDPGETKNGEGRNFPLTPDLRAALEAQRERVLQIQRLAGQIIPWVFVHPFGEGRAAAGSPIKDFRGAWAKACREAEVPGKLLHDLRRRAVRNLERAGVARSAAMKMVGHRTEAIYRRYAITDDAMLKEEALKLAKPHAAETGISKVVAKSGDISLEK